MDSLSGELNAAAIALRRLDGQTKGRAFAYEMTLDAHRYGALIVLDRWANLVRAFGPHLDSPLTASTTARVEAAEKVLALMNQLIDATDAYTREVIEICEVAFRTVQSTFSEEQAIAERNAKLGPMLSEDYTSARRIFLEDLAAR